MPSDASHVFHLMTSPSRQLSAYISFEPGAASSSSVFIPNTLLRPEEVCDAPDEEKVEVAVGGVGGDWGSV